MSKTLLVVAVFTACIVLASGASWGTEPESSAAPGIEVVLIPAPAPAAGSIEPAKLPSPAAAPASARPSEGGKPYTSAIITVDGLKLERSMSPKVRYASGLEVWGTIKVDYETVEDRGIVGYCADLTDAGKNSRCGSNPLILKAIGVAGVRFYSDPVLSDADAALLLAENAKSKFLDKLNVVFVSK